MSIAAVTGCSAIKNPFENDSATEETSLRWRCIYFSFFSTTHTRTAAMLGAGSGHRVNFAVVRHILLAWLLTFPGCMALGYAMARLFLSLSM